MHIRQASIADAYDVAAIGIAAFWNDPFSDFRFPHRDKYPEVMLRSAVQRVKQKFYKGANVHVMVTDDSDAEWKGSEKVIGAIVLIKNAKGERAVKQSWSSWLNLQLSWLEDQYIWHLRLDKSISRTAPTEMAKSVAKNKLFEKWPENYLVEGLFVDQELQRRGIGGMLLEKAKDVVASDGSGLPLTLIASDQGKGLYLKHEFKSVGRWHFGREMYGEAMIWEPAGERVQH